VADHAIKETIFEKDDHHAVAPAASYLTTFAVLVVLTVAQIGVGFSDLGPWKVVVALAIAVVQTGVLAYFFMDLRHADALTWLCAGAALFWLFILFTFTLTDYLTRHLLASPGPGALGGP
jgi:cytochrome c oxidase subunit 4